MTPRERVLSFLAGEAPRPAPVLPIYLDLYTAPFVARLLTKAYARELPAGGYEPVRPERHVELVAETKMRAFALIRPEPDWINVGFDESPSALRGAQVAVERGRLMWLAQGHNAPVDRSTIGPCLGAWRTKLDLSDLSALDEAVPVPEPDALVVSGALDVARRIIQANAGQRFVLGSVGAPFWGLFSSLGFAGMMEALAEGDWVGLRYLMERGLAHSVAHAAALAHIGVDGIFIEECLASADVISEVNFQRYALPYDERLARAVGALGLPTILYFTGDVAARVHHLRHVAATALAFEESRKGFVVDLAAVRSEIGERRPLLGNLDATVLEGADEAGLREAEEAIWAAAGPGAFAHSLGSPITHDTPSERVGRWTEIARGVSSR